MNFRRMVLGTVIVMVSALAVGLVPSTSVASNESDSAGAARTMLLLDSSGSMKEAAGGGKSRIQAAKSALRTVIKDLPDESQVGLRVFGSEVFSRTDPGACADTKLAVEPGTDNRGELLDAVKGYKPYGETPIPAALRAAAKDLGSEGERTVVLVSDGKSTCDPDPCEVAGELAKKGINLHIDVVGLSVDAQTRNQLQCIAEQGNGTYYDANSANEIVSRLERAAKRAIRPFQLTGQAIEGGTAESPTPITEGEWTDTMAAPSGAGGETLHYVFNRETEGTTLRVSAIAQGGGGREGFDLEITNPDGERCQVGKTYSVLIDVRDVKTVQAAAGGDDCSAPGDYLLTLSRKHFAESGPTGVGLRVSEEPPVEEVGFEPASFDVNVQAPNVSGAASDVTGGTSFANATPVETGKYASNIVPGEVQLYKVPVDFGQSAQIQIDFPRPSGAVRDVVGRFPTSAQLTVYNPMQASLSKASSGEYTARIGAEPAKMSAATAEVSRAWFDQTSGSLNGTDDYSLTGDYYFAVSAQRAEYSVEVPYEISVEVVGEPQQGPTYADGVNWTMAEGLSGGTDNETEAPEGEAPKEDSQATDAEDDGGLSAGTIAGGSAVLIGLLALAGGVLLLRRR